MTTESAAPAAAATVPAGAPAVNIHLMNPEEARAAIRERIADKAFGARLRSSDAAVVAAAKSEWSGLHARGFPAPAPLTAEDVGVQAAARSEQAWSDYFSTISREMPLTDEQMAAVRKGEVDEKIFKEAQNEKGRLIRDKAWYRRLQDGDADARARWARVTLILGLRPVKV